MKPRTTPVPPALEASSPRACRPSKHTLKLVSHHSLKLVSHHSLKLASHHSLKLVSHHSLKLASHHSLKLVASRFETGVESQFETGIASQYETGIASQFETGNASQYEIGIASQKCLRSYAFYKADILRKQTKNSLLYLSFLSFFFFGGGGGGAWMYFIHVPSGPDRVARKRQEEEELDRRLMFVGCLTSKQHARVSKGRICSGNFTCCHTKREAAHHTFYLTQSQYNDTGPTCPSADPITPGATGVSSFKSLV